MYSLDAHSLTKTFDLIRRAAAEATWLTDSVHYDLVICNMVLLDAMDSRIHTPDDHSFSYVVEATLRLTDDKHEPIAVPVRCFSDCEDCEEVAYIVEVTYKNVRTVFHYQRITIMGKARHRYELALKHRESIAA
jgi:hypothetical protein